MRGVILVSQWLYAALLYLYPKKFRALYGQQMRQTFGDACQVAYQRKGIGGLWALWLSTLLDLFKSALEERVRQGEITMSKGRLITLAGPLTMVVGVLWLASSIGSLAFKIGLARDEGLLGIVFIPFFFSFIPMLFALMGIRLHFYQSAGDLGRLGLALSVIGCAGVIFFVLATIPMSRIVPEVSQRPWLNYAAVVCVLSIRIGFILFGISALRYRLLRRWNPLPLLLGLTVVLSLPLDWFGVPALLPTQWATPFLHFFITGVCWLLLGVAMIDQRQKLQVKVAV